MYGHALAAEAADPDVRPGLLFMFTSPRARHRAQRRAVWTEVRAELLSEWITDAPGTRPWAWWEFDAPRWRRSEWPRGMQRSWHTDDAWGEPRERLGGVGTPCYLCLGYVPHFRFGIPVSWVQPWAVAYYNGRARDVHGRPQLGTTDFPEGSFPHDAIDPLDPPHFESQAAYLDRHLLLTATERRHLTAADFEPDVLHPREARA
jgi:hypothetical protein